MSSRESSPFYEVEDIIAHATTDYYPRCDTIFLVKWRNYSAKHNQWLPLTDLTEARGTVDAYLGEHGLKLHPVTGADGVMGLIVGRNKLGEVCKASKKRRGTSSDREKVDAGAARGPVSPDTATSAAADVQHECSPGSSISVVDNRNVTSFSKDAFPDTQPILRKNDRKSKKHADVVSRNSSLAPVNANSPPVRPPSGLSRRSRRLGSGINRTCRSYTLDSGDDLDDRDFRNNYIDALSRSDKRTFSDSPPSKRSPSVRQTDDIDRPKRKKRGPIGPKSGKKRGRPKKRSSFALPDDSDDPDVLITDTVNEHELTAPAIDAASSTTEPENLSLPTPKSLDTLAKDLELSASEDEMELASAAAPPSPAPKEPVVVYRIVNHKKVLNDAAGHSPDTWMYTIRDELTGRAETWTHAECLDRDCPELVRYYTRLYEILTGYPRDDHLEMEAVVDKEKAYRSDLAWWHEFAADPLGAEMIESMLHQVVVNYRRTRKTVTSILLQWERHKIIRMLRNGEINPAT